ncbi:MAG: urease accessory protein [Gaiellaceae bacterium]|nr:urease accessory protein [Gaiellaceae bacterium]
MTTATPTSTASAHAGRLRLVVERHGDRSVLVCAEGHTPYAARAVPGPAGWLRVVLVQTIAGPLVGDRTEIDVEVGPDAALEVVANGATLAFPSAAPSTQELRCTVGERGRLAWRPEPLILAASCDLEASFHLSLAAGAAAFTRELVVLGRHGEQAGRYRSSLRCEHEGRPLLHDAIDVDAQGLAAGSGALLGGAGAFASLALLGTAPGEPVDAEEMELAGPGRVLRALAPGPAALQARIAPAETAYLAALGLS